MCSPGQFQSTFQPTVTVDPVSHVAPPTKLENQGVWNAYIHAGVADRHLS